MRTARRYAQAIFERFRGKPVGLPIDELGSELIQIATKEERATPPKLPREPQISPHIDLPQDGLWKPIVETIIEAYPGDVVGAMLAVNGRFGFLPRNVLRFASEGLGVPVVRLFGVASFYGCFRLEPRGKHSFAVCHGTACHVAGAPRLSDALTRELDVAPGGTSADGLVTLDKVACLGCCSLAPVIRVDGAIKGRARQMEALKLLHDLRAAG